MDMALLWHLGQRARRASGGAVGPVAPGMRGSSTAQINRVGRKWRMETGMLTSEGVVDPAEMKRLHVRSTEIKANRYRAVMVAVWDIKRVRVRRSARGCADGVGR